VPILVVLAIVALIGGLGWYGYRGSHREALHPRAENSPRIERDAVSGAANASQPSAAPRTGENAKALPQRDGAAPCSEAVVALGLCTQPRIERKD
jgi:hypothetical protein